MKSISRWLKENSEFDTIQTSEGDICIRSGNKAYKVEEDCEGFYTIMESYSNRILYGGLGKEELLEDLSDLHKELYKEPLIEKSLFGSLESQNKKALKSIDKQLAEFEKAKSSLQKAVDAHKEEFGKTILDISSSKLKDILESKSAAEMLIGIECIEQELNAAKEILRSNEYIGFCKKIDDNTGIFGRDKGKLTVNGGKDGLTSKTAGKVVDKKKKSTVDRDDWSKKEKDKWNKEHSVEESILNEEDVTKDFETFKKNTEDLSNHLANAAKVTELLQQDPTMQRIAKEASVTFSSTTGYMAAAGMALKLLGGFGVPGVGLVGTALMSGSVLAKQGNSISKTLKNPSMSMKQKLLKIAPNVAASALAVSGLGAVGKALGSVGHGGGDVDSTETDTDVTTETSTGDSSSDDLGEPTCENSIAAQANAKPGDILQRADGTKVELTQGDINWAKQLIKDADSGEADIGDVEIDSQDIGEAQVEDLDDNPVLDDTEHVVTPPEENDEASPDEDTTEDTDEVNSEDNEDDTKEETDTDDEENSEDDSEEAAEVNSEDDEDTEESSEDEDSEENDDESDEATDEDEEENSEEEPEVLETKKEVEEAWNFIKDDSDTPGWDELRSTDFSEQDQVADLYKATDHFYKGSGTGPYPEGIDNPLKLEDGSLVHAGIPLRKGNKDFEFMARWVPGEEDKLELYTEDGINIKELGWKSRDWKAALRIAKDMIEEDTSWFKDLPL